MNIHLQNIGKRFGQRNSIWIIRDFDYVFENKKAYALTGSNGSGKSTLLKMISGGLSPSIGNVVFEDSLGKNINWSDAATFINFAAPYTELLEYLTLEEHIDFHFGFKQYINGYKKKNVIEAIEMQTHKKKLVKDFSSGMKQRLKLALALFTENPVILLDEPTSNLDVRWSTWYLETIQKIAKNRLVIIASNQLSEYGFCDKVINVGND